MKTILLILLCAVSIYNCSAQSAAPEAVQKAFETKFQGAENVKWEKEGKEWEARFTLKGEKLSANFSRDGKWLETEGKIKIADLPKAVSSAISSKYAGYTITGADRTETLKHGLIFEVDIKKGSEKKEVAFKEDGTPVAE